MSFTLCRTVSRVTALHARGFASGRAVAAPAFSTVELIGKKRAAQEMTTDEINWFVSQFSKGDIADYQCSAWLMAVCLNGMSARETADLTVAMTQSGSVADLSDIPGVKVDKHSTGGVGDKVSLVLAPLVASFDLVVPMMSGRGLGHTGGTLDKLESFPGLTVDLSMDRFKQQLRDVGVAIISTTEDMAPADRRMYALRDVTATVRAIPLQTASIMCKKLAENPDALVLDVKFGSGAFNQEVEEAIQLAQSMVAAGERDGKPTVAFITSMEQPVGRAAGNWVEIKECIDIMNGRWEGVEDTKRLVEVQGGQMLVQGGVAATLADGVELCRRHLTNGAALERFERMVAAQGGAASLVRHPSSWRGADHERVVTAPADGVVTALDALEVGLTGVMLGAGRQRAGEPVDHAAGVELHKKLGDTVAAGEPLVTLHTSLTDASVVDAAAARVVAAYAFGDAAVELPPLISHVVDASGVRPFHEAV